VKEAQLHALEHTMHTYIHTYSHTLCVIITTGMQDVVHILCVVIINGIIRFRIALHLLHSTFELSLHTSTVDNYRKF